LASLIEVANILPRLLKDSRTVFILRPLVSRNYRTRLQRFDFVDRSDPFASLLWIGLGEQLVNTVVRGVSRDDQADDILVKEPPTSHSHRHLELYSAPS
jgi:hypothetical protein